jgi:hypothetical protein
VAESIAVGNTKIPALRPDSTLLLSKKPPVPVLTDTQSIKQAFAPISNAIRTGLIAEVDRAFLGLAPTERTLYEKMFARGTGFRVTPMFSAWAIAGDTADVTVSLHVIYHEKNAAEPNSIIRNYHAKLVRRAGTWQVTELASTTG